MSCINHNNDLVEQDNATVLKDTLVVKYATGFSLDDSHSDFTKILINSNKSTFSFTDSIFLPHNDDFVAGKEV
jgi:hypothetical protein